MSRGGTVPPVSRFGESNKREWLRLLERYGVLDVKPLAEQYHMRIAE